MAVTTTLAAVQIKNLDFHYAENSGIHFSNFNLRITAGERFGLFGPNGAGKSTLMHLMTGILRCNKGTLRLFDHDINKNKKEVNKIFGFVPQDFSFYQELSTVENLHFFGAWAGLNGKEIKQRTAELLEVLGLAAVRNKQVAAFSGGMKRRVNLAIALMHTPKILFLDEPTVGVDVQTRHAIIDYLKELNRSGMTLVYTSHQLKEAEELCERVALMDHGKIIACNTMTQLLDEYKETDLENLFLHLTGSAYRDL